MCFLVMCVKVYCRNAQFFEEEAAGFVVSEEGLGGSLFRGGEGL